MLSWAGQQFSYPHPKQDLIIKCLLLMIAVAIVYYPAMHGSYIWDDDEHITHNLTLRTWEGLLAIWTELGATPQYYPMVFSSFWAEYQLWELNPLGYHVDNVILHFLNAVLLWRILLLLGVPGAWFAGALFALHPVHVESVAWISERKNVLSGFFYLSTMYLFLRYCGFTTLSAVTNLNNQQTRWVYYLAALILFLLALLSKTVTCTLPAALLLLLWWKRDRISKKEIISLLPFFLLAILMAMVTIRVEHYFVGAQGEEWQLTFGQRFMVAGWALWFYIGKLFIPINLTFIYPRWDSAIQSLWPMYFPLFFLALLVGLWIVRNRIGKGPLTAALYFAGTLSPALGFVDYYPMRYSFVADHFQYLASIGPIVLFAAIFTSWTQTLSQRYKRVYIVNRPHILNVIPLLLLSVLTWQQGHIYKNSFTLWNDTLEKNPTAWIAHNNLGAEFVQAGKLDTAIPYFLKTLELKPDYVGAYNNLGVILTRQKNYSQAIPFLQKALALDATDYNANNTMGIAKLHMGLFEEAHHYLQQALKIKPESVDTLYHLGVCSASLGNIDNAQSFFKKALTLQPNHAAARRNLDAISNFKQKK